MKLQELAVIKLRWDKLGEHEKALAAAKAGWANGPKLPDDIKAKIGGWLDPEGAMLSHVAEGVLLLADMDAESIMKGGD